MLDPNQPANSGGAFANRRNTPLHSVHERLGASFTDFGGWNMPVRYTSDIGEHHAVRRTAGMFDLCHMGEIEVTGPQAGAALDFALVGKLSAIAVGKAKYTMMCDGSGGIVDDLVVYRIAEEQFMIVANASNAETVLGELQDRIGSFEAEVRDVRDDWALIAVQGPASVDIIAEITDIGISGLKYYAIDEANLAGIDVLIARTGYTGEDGFEIYCDPANAVHIWESVAEAGTPYGLVPAGLACRDTLRLEAGMPLYGHELTRSTTPFDAGLSRVIAFQKEGSFVGRQSLETRREAGSHQQLVGLISQSRKVPRSGHRVLDAAGRLVGEVTSGAPSPTLGKPVALAYVQIAHADVGTRLVIDVRGTAVEAQVVSLPFYTRPKT